MPNPSVHEALIYLMVVTSASDRDMTDPELGRIGEVVQSWPVFADFDVHSLVATAQDCQRLLHEPAGLDGVLALAQAVIPPRLHDTAYAAAVEVAAVDLEMRIEEARVLDRLRAVLAVTDEVADGIDYSAKARHRMLT
ncbi:MAG: tellurite resistance TerB family protein [Rhizobiaceae bacterium]